MGSDMIAPTQSGIFETKFNREDAAKRPHLNAKINGFTYDLFAKTFRGTEQLRSNAYLMQQQKFCTQYSDDESCLEVKQRYESDLFKLLNDTIIDVQKVFSTQIGKQNALMKDYIKSLEAQIRAAYGIERNQGVTDLNNALLKVEEFRLPNKKAEDAHRKAYFERLYNECKMDTKIKDVKDEPAPNPVRNQENSKGTKILPVEHPETAKAKIIKETVERIVERERIVEVQLQPPPPPKVEHSNPIEISATRKPAKPKSNKRRPTKPKTDAQIQQLTDNANKTTVNDFADAKARSNNGTYGIYSAVAVKSKHSGLLEVFLQKCSGDYGSVNHTCAVDSNGVSRAYDVDPSDKNSYMRTLLAYSDYFLFFPHNHSYKFTVQRIDAKAAAPPLFRSPHAIRESKAVHKVYKCNFNRNVQLEGDMLYFIDTNCHVVQYDLKQLLSSDGTVNPNYAPTIHQTVCEDFCVSPNKFKIVVITKDGLLSQTNKPLKVDLKTLESGKLGTQYGTIETLGGYYVVASYNAATQSVAYSVFSAQLEFLAFAAKPSANQMVQNMLLYVRHDTLHILAANEINAVDVLLFNDTANKVHLIQSFAVGSTYLNGLVWRVESQEALLCGRPGILKTLKLN